VSRRTGLVLGRYEVETELVAGSECFVVTTNESTAIETLTYHAPSQLLGVAFLKSRAEWIYGSVPWDVFRSLAEAVSLGRAYQEILKGKFPTLEPAGSQTKFDRVLERWQNETTTLQRHVIDPLQRAAAASILSQQSALAVMRAARGAKRPGDDVLLQQVAEIILELLPS
jgi:hypothetical protein